MTGHARPARARLLLSRGQVPRPGVALVVASLARRARRLVLRQSRRAPSCDPRHEGGRRRPRRVERRQRADLDARAFLGARGGGGWRRRREGQGAQRRAGVPGLPHRSPGALHARPLLSRSGACSADDRRRSLLSSRGSPSRGATRSASPPEAQRAATDTPRLCTDPLATRLSPCCV